MATLLEVKNSLFSFFISNDIFTIEDIDSLELSVSGSLAVSLVETSMNDLENKLIVRSVKVGDKKVWILEQPLQSYAQSIEISGHLANSIGEAVNFYCSQVDNKEEVVDKMNLSTRDIENMYLIMLDLMKKHGGVK